MTPYEYQRRLVNDIVRKISEGYKKIMVQLATGGGKTVCFSYLLQRYFAKFPSAKVVILVHREELQQQTIKTLAKFGIHNVSVFMVETFNNQIKKHGLKEIDFMIIDEAHIGNFKKVIEHYRESETVIIGFSATPISATKKHPLKVDYQTICVGVEINQLIDQGNLSPAIHYSAKNSIDKKSLKKSGGDYTLDSLALEYSKPKLVDAVVAAYERYCKGKKTIVFNTTIAHADLVNDAFLQHGYNSRSLDSKAEGNQRATTLKWLADTPDAILNNVSILTTGFDEPSIEAVIFNRCTKSLPLWLQCCGRGARVSPNTGKEFFIIVDLGDNIYGEGHDYWNAKHDWNNYFYYPDIPGEGAPPMKTCPNEECGALIYMSATVCKFCGHLMPREVVYSDMVADLRLLPDKPIKKNSSIALENAVHETAARIKSLRANEAPNKRELLEHSIKTIYSASSFQLNSYILKHLLQRYAEYCA